MPKKKKELVYDEDFKNINMLQAQRLVEAGLDDKFISRFFNITLRTWNYWKKEYPDFGKNLEDWKAKNDSKVEKSLLKRALGYTRKKITKDSEGNIIDEKEAYYPPSDFAIKLWLTNRLPELWQDKQAVSQETKQTMELKLTREDIKERITESTEEDKINYALQ